MSSHWLVPLVRRLHIICVDHLYYICITATITNQNQRYEIFRLEMSSRAMGLGGLEPHLIPSRCFRCSRCGPVSRDLSVFGPASRLASPSLREERWRAYGSLVTRTNLINIVVIRNEAVERHACYRY